MPSAIDPTVPVAGNPTTASVRANFATAQSEISALQNNTTGAPFLPLSGGQMQGVITLHNDPTGPMQPVTLGYFQANGGGGPGSGGIPDAPADGTLYGRQDGAWLHAVNTAELDAAVNAAPYLPLSGGVLTGMLTLSGSPTAALHPATKGYTDTTFLALSGGTLNGNLSMGTGTTLTLAQDASSPLQAVTLEQLQAGYLPLTGGILNGNLQMGTGRTLTLAQNASSGLQAVPLQQLTGGYLPLSGGTLTGNLAAGISISAPPVGMNGIWAYQHVAPYGGGIVSNVTGGNAIASGTGMQLVTTSSGAQLSVWPSGTPGASFPPGTNFIFGPSGTLQWGSPGAAALIIGNAGVASQIQLLGFNSQIYSDGTYFGIGINGPFNNPANYRIVFTGGQWQYLNGSTVLEQIDSVGNMTIHGTLSQGSDARNKTDIADYPAGLAEVMRLQPRTWEKYGTVEAGFVAQEVEPILPEAVIIIPDPPEGEGTDNYLPDRRYLGDPPIIAAVVNAVQELANRVTQLESART